MTNKKITVLVAIALMVIVAIIIFYVSAKEGEIPQSNSWAGVKKFANPMFGTIRVADSESGKTLFFYSDEPLIYPTTIEKIGDDEWRVTFKKKDN